MESLYKILREQKERLERDSKVVDDMVKNGNFMNSQNYVISNELKKRVIFNYEVIKTKVNWKIVHKYFNIWRYKWVHLKNSLKMWFFWNKLFVTIMTLGFLLPIAFSDITFIEKFLILWFVWPIFYLVLYYDRTKDYLLIRDKENIYYTSKNNYYYKILNK